MAHARKAERPVPPIFTLHVPAVLATLAAAAMAALLAVSIFGPIRVGPVADDRIVVSPAVIESGRQWELQRKQQSGTSS